MQMADRKRRLGEPMPCVTLNGKIEVKKLII
jgi:hypothetical protein